MIWPIEKKISREVTRFLSGKAVSPMEESTMLLMTANVGRTEGNFVALGEATQE